MIIWLLFPAHDYLATVPRTWLFGFCSPHMIIWLLFPAHDYLANIPRTWLCGYCSPHDYMAAVPPHVLACPPPLPIFVSKYAHFFNCKSIRVYCSNVVNWHELRT
jgi:hypothetical protein